MTGDVAGNRLNNAHRSGQDGCGSNGVETSAGLAPCSLRADSEWRERGLSRRSTIAHPIPAVRMGSWISPPITARVAGRELECTSGI